MSAQDCGERLPERLPAVPTLVAQRCKLSARVEEIEAVEALRARILMEADEAFRREIVRSGLGNASHKPRLPVTPRKPKPILEPKPKTKTVPPRPEHASACNAGSDGATASSASGSPGGWRGRISTEPGIAGPATSWRGWRASGIRRLAGCGDADHSRCLRISTAVVDRCGEKGRGYLSHMASCFTIDQIENETGGNGEPAAFKSGEERGFYVARSDP